MSIALKAAGATAAGWLTLVVILTCPRVTLSRSRAVVRLRRAVINPGLAIAQRADTVFTLRRIEALKQRRK